MCMRTCNIYHAVARRQVQRRDQVSQFELFDPICFLKIDSRKGGMIRLETLIGLRFLDSNFSSLSAY